MTDPAKRRLVKLGIAVGITVLGPIFTVIDVLGGVTVLAAEADVHGLIPAMRIAVVAAVAVVVVPFGWWAGATLCDRIDAKEHRRQLAALRRGDIAAHTQSSSPARHRKVA